MTNNITKAKIATILFMIFNLTKDSIMYKKFLGAATLALTLAVSSTSFAHSEMCGANKLQHMVSSLKLDDAQKQKIQPIMDNLKTTIQQDWQQLHDLNQQIDAQAVSASMDQSTVNDLVDKKTKLIGDMIKAKVNAENQVIGILNAQQKVELQGMMIKAKEKMEKKMQHCHDHK